MNPYHDDEGRFSTAAKDQPHAARGEVYSDRHKATVGDGPRILTPRISEGGGAPGVRELHDQLRADLHHELVRKADKTGSTNVPDMGATHGGPSPFQPLHKLTPQEIKKRDAARRAAARTPADDDDENIPGRPAPRTGPAPTPSGPGTPGAKVHPRDSLTPEQARARIQAGDAARPRAAAPTPAPLATQVGDLFRHPFTDSRTLDTRRRAAEGPHLLSSRPDLHAGSVGQVHDHLQRQATRDVVHRSLDGPRPTRATPARAPRQPSPSTPRRKR